MKISMPSFPALREPVALAAFLRAALVAGAAFGLNLDGQQIAALVLVVEAGLALLVRSQVAPMVTVVSGLGLAARSAATAVVGRLTRETVGNLGEITTPASDIINSVVNGVVDPPDDPPDQPNVVTL